jgi:hypothetical protein
MSSGTPMIKINYLEASSNNHCPPKGKQLASLCLFHSQQKQANILHNLKNVMLACVLVHDLGLATLKSIYEGSTMAWDNHRICMVNM